jgi:cell division septum initiation protein DivIVA
MGSFRNGVLVGLGISLLIAPMKGEEMRRLVAERIQYLRGIPPENAELKQSVQRMTERVEEVQQMADRAARMGTVAQDYAQQTAVSASSVQTDLSQVAEQAGTNVPATGQGDADPTRPSRATKPIGRPQSTRRGNRPERPQRG